MLLMTTEVQMEGDTTASWPEKVDYDFPLATDGTDGNLWAYFRSM